jgi:hypothetical protein
MKLVHDLDGDEALPDTDVDSEDEMVGAVHNDGFLRPIKIRRGWRAEDAGPRSPRKGGHHRGRGRKRRRGSADDDDDVDGDRLGESGRDVLMKDDDS